MHTVPIRISADPPYLIHPLWSEFPYGVCQGLSCSVERQYLFNSGFRQPP